MAHDWILGVLSDLADYARKNGLDATAEGAERLLRVVRAEIPRSIAALEDSVPIPPRDRQH